MALDDLIGFSAAVLTTGSFIPQVLRSYRTRDVSGISLGMYVMFALGVALWLGYGVVTRAWPVIIANGITLVLALSILRLKLQSLRAGDAVPEAGGAGTGRQSGQPLPVERMR